MVVPCALSGSRVSSGHDENHHVTVAYSLAARHCLFVKYDGQLTVVACKLVSEAVSPIADAMATSQTLQEVDLSWNPLRR